MCGRFTLRAPAAAVAKKFGLFDVPNLSPHFNISPGQGGDEDGYFLAHPARTL